MKQQWVKEKWTLGKVLSCLYSPDCPEVEVLLSHYQLCLQAVFSPTFGGFPTGAPSHLQMEHLNAHSFLWKGLCFLGAAQEGLTSYL